MTTPDLIHTYSAHGLHEAGLLQVVIEARGIDVSRRGELWPLDDVRIGADAPFVRILVPEDRAEEARQAIAEWLASRGKPRAATPPWTCTSCKEENDASFEVCWKCGDRPPKHGPQIPSNGPS